MEKRGRVLEVNEAQNILESTSTKKTLISWFDPFWSQMIDAIEKHKSTTILNGSVFSVSLCEDKKDYVFRRVGEFVPMTRISLERIKEFESMKNAAATH